MAITTTILIDGDLSNGGFVTPEGSSASPLSTTVGDDLVILTSTGGTGTVANWTVSTIAGEDTVNINGSLLGSNITLGDDADVFNINRFGLGGSINTSSIAGNVGNDTLNLLVGGNGSANSTFRGGQGNDLINLNGLFTNVTVAGGQGNDQFEFLASGRFTGSSVLGGQGDDLLADNGYNVDFSGSSLGGGQGSDNINVSSSYAGLGADGLSILGGAGNDFLFGTFTGQNTIGGGQDNDFIQSFDGDDLLRGGLGNDTIIAGFGNDSVYGDNPGQAGNDVIFGISGSNKIFAAGGNDFVAGGIADDSINGGSGDDTLIGGGGDDTVNGGVGNDIIFGSDIAAQTAGGFQYLNRGTTTARTLAQLAGNQMLLPDGVTPANVVAFDTLPNGVLSLTAGQGTYQPDGQAIVRVTDTSTPVAAFISGVGSQYTTYSAAANIIAEGNPIINLGNYNVLATDTLQPIFDNILTGGDGDDVIFGSLGEDIIDGGSGNDVIIGGQGSDFMSGGGASGNDVFVQGSNGALAGASFAAATGTRTTNWTINWTGNAPDIITDFVANAGGTVVDRVAFSNVDGTFAAANAGTFAVRNATNSADFSAWALNEVVVLAGNWNEANGQFDTANRSSGTANDILVFVATAATGNIAADMGDQAVILLGAANQAFTGANFYGNFA